MVGVREKIRGILEKLNITEAPVDVLAVADLFSIKVVPHVFPATMSGLLVQEGGRAIIGYNSTHADVRQRFTIAHELGHYLSGHDDLRIVDETFDKDTLKEKEANAFAAELLMPYDILLKDLKHKKLDIPMLAQLYKVSDQAMSIRLLQSGLINKI